VSHGIHLNGKGVPSKRQYTVLTDTDGLTVMLTKTYTVIVAQKLLYLDRQDQVQGLIALIRRYGENAVSNSFESMFLDSQMRAMQKEIEGLI